MTSPSHVEVTFRSGATVSFDTTHLKVTRNGLGKVTKLDWTTPAGARRTLMELDLGEIVMIVFVDDEETPDDA